MQMLRSLCMRFQYSPLQRSLLLIAFSFRLEIAFLILTESLINPFLPCLRNWMLLNFRSLCVSCSASSNFKSSAYLSSVPRLSQVFSTFILHLHPVFSLSCCSLSFRQHGTPSYSFFTPTGSSLPTPLRSRASVIFARYSLVLSHQYALQLALP